MQISNFTELHKMSKLLCIDYFDSFQSVLLEGKKGKSFESVVSYQHINVRS